MKLKLLITFLLSASAFAALPTTAVYKVTGIVDAKDGWTGLRTVTGNTLYLRCSKRQFDDVRNDWVSGFDTVEDCEKLISIVRKYASSSNPVEIDRENNLAVKYSL
jgi:hypothetical protein